MFSSERVEPLQTNPPTNCAQRSWGLRATAARPERMRWEPQPSFYIDYQDCHYQGVEYMLCGGVGGYDAPLGSIAFGGLDRSICATTAWSTRSR
jgi:hypothetical protein